MYPETNVAIFGAVAVLLLSCGPQCANAQTPAQMGPSTIVAVSRDGREQVVAQVTYRGGDKRIVVLKKGNRTGSPTSLFSTSTVAAGSRYPITIAR